MVVFKQTNYSANILNFSWIYLIKPCSSNTCFAFIPSSVDITTWYNLLNRDLQITPYHVYRTCGYFYSHQTLQYCVITNSSFGGATFLFRCALIPNVFLFPVYCWSHSLMRLCHAHAGLTWTLCVLLLSCFGKELSQVNKLTDHLLTLMNHFRSFRQPPGNPTECCQATRSLQHAQTRSPEQLHKGLWGNISADH